MGRKKDIFEEIDLARVPYFHSEYRPSFFLILFIIVALGCLVAHGVEVYHFLKHL